MDNQKTTAPPPPDAPALPAEPHRKRSAGLWIAAATFVVGLVLGALLVPKLLQPRGGAGNEPSADVPSSPAPVLSSAADLSCAKELDQIRDIFKEIPEIFAGLTSAQLKDVTDKVQRCRQRLEAFVADCKGAPGLHEAQFMLAKLLLSLHRVVWTDYVNDITKQGKDTAAIVNQRDRWSAQYFGRILELAAAALEKVGKGTPLRAECLDVLGDAHFQNKEHAKAYERYQQLRAEFPDYQGGCALALAEGNALTELGRFSDALGVVRKAMADCPNDSNFPYYLDYLWKINERAGDLSAMEKAVLEMRAVIPERAKRVGIAKLEREAYERTLAYSGFRLGYSRFALGDHTGAAEAFLRHVEAMNQLEEDLRKQGSGLPQDYAVYRNRSQDNLKVLNEKAGKPADLDKLSEAIWVGGRKPALQGGKPLAIVFRNYGDDRSAPFLKALDRHARAEPGAYELLAIAFLKAGDDPLGQEAGAFQEAAALGIDGPLGLDPDVAEKSLFGAFGATVGSATFIIVNRAGVYAWFQQDPREIDERFSIAILERILKS